MKIKQATNDTLDIMVRNAALIVGINARIDDGGLTLISNIIREYYPTMDTKDFTEAFKLYAVGKLKYRDSAYNNINATFIGRVIESYKEYKREKKLIVELDSTKLLAAPEEDKSKAFEFIKKHKDELKSPYFIANWKGAFFYAKEEGILKLTKEKVTEMKDKVTMSVAKEKVKCKTEGRDMGHLNDVGYLRNEYYRAVMMDYFS